jgi:hypothetical protein
MLDRTILSFPCGGRRSTATSQMPGWRPEAFFEADFLRSNSAYV